MTSSRAIPLEMGVLFYGGGGGECALSHCLSQKLAGFAASPSQHLLRSLDLNLSVENTTGDQLFIERSTLVREDGSLENR